MSETDRTADSEQADAYRDEITRRIHEHADGSVCRLNPNRRIVEAIIKGLVRRKMEFGDYYCPCRVVTGKAETDSANVCPCETHEDEIARTGQCHCALFVGEKHED